MSKFARQLSEAQSAAQVTTNLAGGSAFVVEPEQQLVNLVLTNMVRDQFYRSTDQMLKQVRGLLDAIDLRFAAQVAIYARTQAHMRSITHVLAAEICYRVKGPQQPARGTEKSWIPSFLVAVCQRPDDAIEIAAYYSLHYGGKLPRNMQKGLRMYLETLDAYALGKYNTNNALVNLTRVTHPRSSVNENLQFLMDGTLPTPDTWETAISAAGSDPEKKGAEWTRLVLEGQLGYMALLRNLRNIAEHATSEALSVALERISNPEEVLRSKQFPFRFLTAIVSTRQLSQARQIRVALDQAIDVSMVNVPQFEGRVAIFLDDSGSMATNPVNGEQSRMPVYCSQVGGLFAAALYQRNDAELIMYSNDAQRVREPRDQRVSVLAGKIMQNFRGGGTKLSSAFRELHEPVDRLIIISDNESWMENRWGWRDDHRMTPDEAFADYKRRSGANPVVFAMDLTGYGTSDIKSKGVHWVGGFSDKVFDVMRLREEGTGTLVKQIKAITF